MISKVLAGFIAVLIIANVALWAKMWRGPTAAPVVIPAADAPKKAIVKPQAKQAPRDPRREAEAARRAEEARFNREVLRRCQARYVFGC